jgi:hypothetical protein
MEPEYSDSSLSFAQDTKQYAGMQSSNGCTLTMGRGDITSNMVLPQQQVYISNSLCDGPQCDESQNTENFAHGNEFLTNVLRMGLNLYLHGQYFYVRHPYRLLYESNFFRDQVHELESIQSTTLYLDKDPEMFQHILRYLNTGYLFPLSHSLLIRLKIESRFYNMFQLTDLIASQISCVQVNAKGVITHIIRSDCLPFDFLMLIFECEPTFLTDEYGRPYIDIESEELHFVLDIVSNKYNTISLPQYLNKQSLEKTVKYMMKKVKEEFAPTVGDQLLYVQKMLSSPH